MKLTIRNKLIAGFTGVLLLMTAMAGVAGYAVFTLRHSAQEATRVGGQLNSVALEIQVHNLEAERRIKSYLAQVNVLGAQKARELYLDEAEFETNQIRSLAAKASALAPNLDKRAKFDKITATLAQYDQALNTVISLSERKAASTERKAAFAEMQAAVARYEMAAESLHENAEDGEVAGQDASQVSQDDIARVSRQSVTLVVAISIAGLLLGSLVSYKLSKAILVPVEHLKSVAENVSLGNLDMAVRRYSEDEIGDLADSFSRMVTAVKFFRMEAELGHEEVARQKGEAG